MAENQKSSSGSLNRDSKTGKTVSSDMRDGKAKGSPSNVKESDIDMTKKNKEGSPDERKIQGDETSRERRSEGDVNNSGRESESGSYRRNGGSV